MTNKEKARSAHDAIKEIAVKTGHKELLKLCRQLDAQVETLDDDEEDGDNGDPGGNSPPHKPKVP